MRHHTNNHHGIKNVLPGNQGRGALFSFSVFFLLILMCGSSCKKAFLNVVPDNVPTIANAFTSKTEAEKYLFTCYSYLPSDVDPTYNVGLTAGDEVWIED